nr:hypothetical protein GCM10020241_28790 [Streptoalloteichus tenebrarius]
MARVRPSGELTSSSTRPSWPVARRRGCTASSGPDPPERRSWPEEDPEEGPEEDEEEDEERLRASRSPTGAISTASSPWASVTQATRPLSPSTTGRRARTPGSTDTAIAGPSRWVSQCTVPRTSTTLARPVRSGWNSPSSWEVRTG